jgi:hypothetical protein
MTRVGFYAVDPEREANPEMGDKISLLGGSVEGLSIWNRMGLIWNQSILNSHPVLSNRCRSSLLLCFSIGGFQIIGGVL